MEFDPNNLTPWIKHWLPVMEHKMDERLVMVLKLRNGFIDGINHTYKSIGLKIKNKSNTKLKKNDYLSGARARELYHVGRRNLQHHVGRYINDQDE